MKRMESPESSAASLTALFPAFAQELEGEEISSYHNIILVLTPLVSGYLQRASERTVKKFCELIDAMSNAGGEKENTIATCLLEHASHVHLRKIIQPYLGPIAKRELR